MDLLSATSVGRDWLTNLGVWLDLVDLSDSLVELTSFFHISFSFTSSQISYLPTVIKAFVNFFSAGLESLDIQNSRHSER